MGKMPLCPAWTDVVDRRRRAAWGLTAPLSSAWRPTLGGDSDLVPDVLETVVRNDALAAFLGWTGGRALGVLGAVL
jgi:hypothetical protein